MMDLSAHFLPQLVPPDALSGATVVVIDVLRASTVIARALAAGAREVIPCLQVDEARRIAASLPAGTAVLGGERGGLRIEGFHLGNSPDEYSAASVGGRTVVFTTTNGTRAMQACRSARRVLVGAFVNRLAVCRALEHEERVHLLCAGTEGRITREDVLLAGAIVETLLEARQRQVPPHPGPLPEGEGSRCANDEARLALSAWHEVAGGGQISPARIAVELADSQGGRNLIQLGLEKDFEAVARIDSVAEVPVLELGTWRIVRGA
jgi:2-phosphosulfolactate phosphatase